MGHTHNTMQELVDHNTARELANRLIVSRSSRKAAERENTELRDKITFLHQEAGRAKAQAQHDQKIYDRVYDDRERLRTRYEALANASAEACRQRDALHDQVSALKDELAEARSAASRVYFDTHYVTREQHDVTRQQLAILARQYEETKAADEMLREARLKQEQTIRDYQERMIDWQDAAKYRRECVETHAKCIIAQSLPTLMTSHAQAIVRLVTV